MFLKRLAVHVIALALMPYDLLCTTQAQTQADMKPPVTPERIARDLRTIESAAGSHATGDELGKLWEQLASDYLHEMDFYQAEEAYNRALKLLRGSGTATVDYAMALDGLGSIYLVTGRLAESENCRRKAIAIFEAQGDRKTVDRLHRYLAGILLEERKYKEAENEASKATEGMLGQVRPDATDLVYAFIARGYARCYQRRCKEGLSDAEQAVDIVRAFVPPNSLAASVSWRTLGYMEWKTGDVAGAEEKMRRALQILSEKSELPYPLLVRARIVALRQYQQFLNETHRKAEARQLGDEIARLTREQTPLCSNCTVNVEGLSNAMH